MRRIAVVGGGAAGCFAAIFASMNGSDVVVFEKNSRPLRKVMITGKGRCNVTNDANFDKLMSSVVSNPKFLYSAFSNFDCKNTVEFFNKLGVELKTERGGRIFPVSDKAVTIVDAIYKAAKDNKVKFVFENVNSIEGSFLINGKYKFDSVIIATGGLSYPLTGSTGDGYKFSAKFGHTVTDISPSLVPLESSDAFCSELSGLSLKNVVLSVYNKNNLNKKVFSDIGEMLFCHFGISGPLVLSASCHLNFKKYEYVAFVDLKPGLDESKLDKRITRDFAENGNKALNNIIGKLLPVSLGKTVLNLCGISGEKKACTVTKEERLKICRLIKSFKISIKGSRPINEAIVTRGGVNVLEVNPKTMESKKVPNLYFAGEILDVDAYTGGYNLQIAFSTGALAGKSAALKKGE